MKKNIFLFLIFSSLIFGISLRVRYLYHYAPKPSVAHMQLVMDRHLLASQLIFLFGPDSRQIIHKNLSEIGAPLGGGCDFYKVKYDEDQNAIDPFTRCPAGLIDVNTPIFTKENALRVAALGKTCALLSEKNELVDYLITLTHHDRKNPITHKAVEDLFFAFNKTPISDDEKKPFSRYLAGQVTDRPWNKLVYDLCASPDWQIL